MPIVVTQGSPMLLCDIHGTPRWNHRRECIPLGSSPFQEMFNGHLQQPGKLQIHLPADVSSTVVLQLDVSSTVVLQLARAVLPWTATVS